MGDIERWYSIRGRIGRQTWILRFVGVIAIFIAPILLPQLFFAGNPPEDVREVAGLSAIPIMLGCLVFRIMQDIKRLHDLGRSGWFAFCAVIPGINFIYLVILAFADGQPHRNEFGPDPKRRDEGFGAVADVFR